MRSWSRLLVFLVMLMHTVAATLRSIFVCCVEDKVVLGASVLDRCAKSSPKSLLLNSVLPGVLVSCGMLAHTLDRA